VNPLQSWRLPLRLARRDALRHRARSLLVLVMIALPVLAVTAADVLIQTQDVSGRESLDRRIGTAQALIIVSDGVTSVEQPPDPDDCCAVVDGDGETPAPSADQVSSLLDGARLLELRHGDVDFRTDKGVAVADTTEVDLRNGLTRGLFDLTSGRWPKAADEVVVNQALLDRGYRLGDRLELTRDDAPTGPTIVGVAESTTARSYPAAAGPSARSGSTQPAPPSGSSTARRSRGRSCVSSTGSART
jgi:putative ABC transport system permease protein